MAKNSILKHFATIGAGTILNMALGFFATILITRLVSPAHYGELSLFKMYGSLAGSILLLGLDQALIRYYYNSNDIGYKKSLLYFCTKWPLVITVFISILVSILSTLIFLDVDYTVSQWFALFIYIVGIIISRFSSSVLRLEYKTKQYSLANISQQIVYIVFSVLLLNLFKEKEVAVLIIATILGQLTVAFISIIAERNLWWLKVDNLSMYNLSGKELIQYAWPFIITTSIATFLQSIDRISLNIFCDYAEVGVYSSALVLMNVFALLQSTFNTLWTPLSIEHYTKHPADTEFYKNAQEIITVLMFLFGMTIILFKDIFTMVLGNDYQQAAYLIPYLAFHPIMYTISEVTVGGLVFKKKSSMQVIISLIPGIVNFIGNMLLVPLYGGRGAAMSTGFSYILFFVLRTVLSNRYYYIDYSLRRFSLILVEAVIFATYATFNTADIILVSLYGFAVTSVLMLYKRTVKVIMAYGFAFISEIAR